MIMSRAPELLKSLSIQCRFGVRTSDRMEFRWAPDMLKTQHVENVKYVETMSVL